MKTLILLLGLALSQVEYKLAGRLGPVQLWHSRQGVILRYQSARVPLSGSEFAALVRLLRQTGQGRVKEVQVVQFAGGTNLRLKTTDVPLAPPDIELAEPAFRRILKGR